MILENKKILFICGAKGSYVRNKLIYQLLSSKNQVTKITSEANFYFLRLPIILIKFLVYPKKNIDYIFVGFLAQPLVFCLSYLTSKPIISDLFISLYDTLCYDRQGIKPTSMFGKIIYQVDKKTIDNSVLIITDTKAHSRYFQTTFKTNPDKIQTIYLGAETNLFYQQSSIKKEPNPNFTVFYYGSVQPLHGTDTILKAAKLLENEQVNWIIVGPVRKKFDEFIKKLKLTKVAFIPWIPYNELSAYINKADICLGGPFGTSDKANRVITGKTYQFAAMGKPLILGNTTGNKELFANEENCLLVTRNNESELAQAVLKLKNNHNLRDQIGKNAHKLITNLQQQITI